MQKARCFLIAAACAVGIVRGASAAAPGSGGITIAPPPAAPPATSEALMAPKANQSMTVDALLGYVNDQPIYATDLFRDIDDQLTQLGKSAHSLREFESKAGDMIQSQVNRIVSDQLLYTAAQSALTDSERSNIDTQINFDRRTLIASYGGSLAAADKALAQKNSSVSQEMAREKRHFIEDMYIARHIYRKIEITQQMARDEYARDPKRWHQPEQVELDTLTLPVSRWLRAPSTNGEAGPIMANPTPAQIQAAEAKALATGKEIVTKLKAGADFATLVQDYNSEDENFYRGGKSRPLQPGTLNDTTYEKRIFALPVNAVDEPYLDHEKDFQHSKVIITKVLSKQPEKVISFVEAQNQIMDDLRAQQLSDLRDKEMQKLGAGTPVEAIDRMMDVAMNAAVARYATSK